MRATLHMCGPSGGARFTLASITVFLMSSIIYPVSASAQDYLPLDIGNEWYYEDDLGETQLMTITGEEEILGALTRVRRQQMTTDLFENFWTADSAGNVYIHGARNLVDDFEVAYLPPILMVDAPLAYGKAWVTEGVMDYDLDGTPWGGDPYDYSLRVYFEGFVAVPAGDFYSYGVGYDAGPVLVRSAAGEFYDIFGRRLRAGEQLTEADITEWYSDGTGLAQQTTYAAGEHPLRLIWWNPTVFTEASSWGRIKHLFR